MIGLIENGLLNSNLDCSSFVLLNVADLQPLPSTVCSSTDPRLTDKRVPLDGSIVDSMVSLTAGIQQTKLNLNGTIPAAWLGTAAGTAAAGNLAEYKSNKGVANGYAALDATGKVPAAQMATGAGLGTVTSVGLSFPTGYLTVSGSPVTTSGTLTATWVSQAPSTWFGNPSTVATATPTFNTSKFPVALIPALDASIITTGVFLPAQIPGLDASKIISGTFGSAQIANLDASDTTTGVFATAQIPNLDASKITTGTISSARLPPGPTYAAAQTSPVTPSGNTTSLSPVMMGVGGTLTPTATGKVLASFGGNIANLVGSSGSIAGLWYGLGTAPANGAAATGTQVGSFAVQNDPDASSKSPFVVKALITGLIIGTTYWFDLSLQTNTTGGTAYMTGCSLTAVELP